MKRRKRNDKEGLTAELASLPQVEREELVSRWQVLYGSPAPAKMSRQFLVRAIAYKMQENLLGGLKPATRKFLEKVAADANGKMPPPPHTIKSGTRLLRAWHGKTYEVVIMDKGVLFNGNQYKSLSEVAKIITSAKWSGPLFSLD